MGILSNRKRVKITAKTKGTTAKKVAVKVKAKSTPKKVSLKKNEDGEFIVVGPNSDLLAEACKLDKQKKKAEKRLKEIKKAMGFTDAGDYVNDKGNRLVVSHADNFSDIDPEELYNLFVKKKKKKKFFTTVKVQLGILKKLIPQTKIDDMREELDPTVKWSYK